MMQVNAVPEKEIYAPSRTPFGAVESRPNPAFMCPVVVRLGASNGADNGHRRRSLSRRNAAIFRAKPAIKTGSIRPPVAAK